ncbi:MAG: lytic murein transglycosylase [Patescibacteria group bacterium]|nr:lytic murein transglycosylase [Patescibacteria group bacterium]MDE2172335.1 lytic murein transglycosylase [Patescibacteria group bacterium]
MSEQPSSTVEVVYLFLLAGFFWLSQALPAAAQTQTPVSAAQTDAQRAALQQQLAQVEAEEQAANAQLTKAQSQSASLSRDIAVLDAKIKAAQLDIKAKNLLIQSLGSDISDKQSHINDLEDHIAKGKETLAQLLRKTNEIDAYSLPEVVLSETSISGFFQDLDTFQSVQSGLYNTISALNADESSTTAAKDALSARQNAEIDARYAIQQQQQNIQADEVQQKQLLSISKGNEKSYAALVSEKSAQAAQIRAALFALAGGSSPIPFGDALSYAEAASARTGVDPAFLLAILTQESNLGKNVGNCYLANTTTGDGINVKTGNPVSKVMSPTRDVPPFITLTNALGRQPLQTVVSCPQSVGWGGAMGPAQFIASTWTLLEHRVADMLGISPAPPDPWNPKHAIMAEAVFMSDLGASSGSYTAELNAACRYFGGGTHCTSITRPYGNNVMALANSIQRNQIDPLAGL